MSTSQAREVQRRLRAAGHSPPSLTMIDLIIEAMTSPLEEPDPKACQSCGSGHTLSEGGAPDSPLFCGDCGRPRINPPTETPQWEHSDDCPVRTDWMAECRTDCRTRLLKAQLDGQ